MKSLIITGPSKAVNGTVDISGAKNSCLPLMAASILFRKEVILRNVQISCMDSSKHSFENGMVLRNFMGKVVISVKGGSLYVGNVIHKNKDIINKIIPGDIFYTSIKKLDLNKRKNIYVLKDKIIYNNKKNYLKKLKI